MHTINVRNINDAIYKKLKNESKKQGLSINKFLLKILDRFFERNRNEVEYHDLDDFFGTWTEEEHQRVTEGASEARTIDEELWK